MRRHTICALIAFVATAARADFEVGRQGWAPVPKGAVSWAVLTAAEAVPWTSADGVTHLAPRFPKTVLALEGKRVRIAGYMVASEEEGGPPSHFALYASRIDCELHLPPGPTAYIDVTSVTPPQPTAHALVIEGKLELVHARQGGIFYRMRGAHVSRLAKRD